MKLNILTVAPSLGIVKIDTAKKGNKNTLQKF